MTSRTLLPTLTRVSVLLVTIAAASLAIGLLLGIGGAAAVTGATTTFTPVADSYVQSDQPSTNFGTQTQVRADGSPIVRAYLRFSVQGLSGSVTSAVLRMHANSTHPTGYTVSAVQDTTWGETTLTYGNAPPVGSAVGSSGAFSAGAATQVTVTPLVAGNGLVSIALTTTSSTAMSLASRESGANAPQLVVTTSGSTDTVPPAAPTGVQASALSASRAAVGWAANTEPDLAGYRVLRGPSGGTAAQVGTTPAGVTTFTDTGLTPSTAYDYSVVAVDGSGNASPASAPATVTTPADTTPPTVPAGLTATSSGSSTIALSWSASTDDVGVVAYDVFRDGGALPIGSPSGTSFSDSGLAPGSSHTYTVVARDAAGNSSQPSAAAGATTAQAPDTTPPAPPTGVSAQPNGATRATVTWSANTETDLAAYRVLRSIASGGAETQVGSTGAAVTTFIDTGLSPSTDYDYRVEAVDTSGNVSVPSAVAPVTTPGDTTPPTVPGGLTATATGSSTIALSWSASTDDVGVTAYDVFRDGSATPIASPSVTAFTDSGLAAGSSHTYTVRARDAAGNSSAPSAPAGATTAAAPPSGGDPVVAAAGDIACGTGYVGSYCVQMQTSDVILGLHPAAVLALGDIQYEQSAYSDYVDASTNPKIGYDKSWGRFKTITYPAIGNHEYLTPLATNYLKYWSQLAAKQGPWAGVSGSPQLGYYSFDVGAWHVIAFNSNCGQVSCSAGSPQETWIKSDLAAHKNACTLVFAHHPFRNSYFETSMEPRYPDLFRDFYDAGVDLLLVGHAHDYERTAPMDPAGNIDDAHGVREFVVGTGGHGPTGTSATPKPFSQAHASPVFGALLLTLHPTGYDWSFKAIPGETFTDSGSFACH